MGLLLGNMDEHGQRALGLAATPENSVVLLTNDLSPAVAQEAVTKKASVVVSYRGSRGAGPCSLSRIVAA